jgi:hypothetical protein
MIFNWPWSQTYRVRCNDGSIKRVYKNIDNAFPLYIGGWKGDFESEVKALEKVDAKVKGGYESKIQGLLYSLDERNRSLMMSFRSIYITYGSDPCKHSAFFERQMGKLLEEQRQLSLIKIRIQGLIDLVKINPKINPKISELFGDLVQELGGKSVAEASAMEINDSMELMKRWSGRG